MQADHRRKTSLVQERIQNKEIGMVGDSRNTLKDEMAGVDRQRQSMLLVKDLCLEKDYRKVCGTKPKWDIDRKYVKYGDAVNEKKRMISERNEKVEIEIRDENSEMVVD